jgi:hypothetical protein
MSLRSPTEDENGGISLHPHPPIFKGGHEVYDQKYPNPSSASCEVRIPRLFPAARGRIEEGERRTSEGFVERKYLLEC